MPAKHHAQARRSKHAALIALALIIVGEACLLLSPDLLASLLGKPPKIHSSADYAKAKDYWKVEIDKVGTAEAYDYFKKDTWNRKFGEAHTLAHIFGDLIYEKEGVQGVVDCDSAFAYGCYHSFFGAAIADKGIGVVSELADACVKRFGMDIGCAHGIGHGLLGYMGDEKLLDALKICKTLPWKNPFGGCESGVFMEFNFHTMRNVDSSDQRPFDPKNPNDPCNRLPKEYGVPCYFEQPQWWLNALAIGNSGDYLSTGLLCKALDDDAERNACYVGIGKIAAPDASYNVSVTKGFCSKLPDSHAVALCLQNASWVFYGEPRAKADASKVCEELSEKERALCAPPIRA